MVKWEQRRHPEGRRTNSRQTIIRGRQRMGLAPQRGKVDEEEVARRKAGPTPAIQGWLGGKSRDQRMPPGPGQVRIFPS